MASPSFQKCSDFKTVERAISLLQIVPGTSIKPEQHFKVRKAEYSTRQDLPTPPLITPSVYQRIVHQFRVNLPPERPIALSELLHILVTNQPGSVLPAKVSQNWPYWPWSRATSSIKSISLSPNLGSDKAE
jgi:hypothetical protein